MARPPDFPPIENGWFMVAEELTCQCSLVTTLELWLRVEAAGKTEDWNVPVHVLKSLFDSMPKSCYLCKRLLLQRKLVEAFTQAYNLLFQYIGNLG
ncbi:hypothetical protein NPIL_41961 [Nephila pilipes]|uniref:Uncharacterized protein n=1 Tax=Nephila pilipes TaxID=299642 RepID=A0A8X6PZT2_NEPPI|nr:hypothetical protein NPIL_41961 [Nephila pilipes]